MAKKTLKSVISVLRSYSYKSFKIVWKFKTGRVCTNKYINPLPDRSRLDILMNTKPSHTLSVSVELRELTLSSSRVAECLMVSDSVQMDSHTVQRRSFTSFGATDEMNNKWITAVMGAGGKKRQLIETRSSANGCVLRHYRQELSSPHAHWRGSLQLLHFSSHPQEWR